MSTSLNDLESRPSRDRFNPGQPRRSHSKSRAGCKTCKERRIKCDESRPICENCIRGQRSCLYKPIKGEIPVPPTRKRIRRKVQTRGPSFVNVTGGDVAQKDREAVRDVFRHILIPNAEGICEIDRWSAAPGTCLSICTQGVKVGSTDLELINLYCTLTSKSIPFANVRDQPWQSPAFEISRQNPYLYHVTLALSAAHLRHLRGVPTPDASETDHLCKAISAYRAVISTPDPSGFPISLAADVRAVFATSALLVAYLWGCPQDDIYTNVSILTGSKHLVRAFWARPEFSIIYTSMDIHAQYWAEIYASFNIGEYRIIGLEMLFPGHDIYSQNRIFASTEAPFDDPTQVVNLGAVTQLATIISIISSPRKVERRIFSMVVKIVLAWVAATHSVFLMCVKQRNRKAYILTAHYFAVVWKVGRMAETFANEPPSNEDDEFVIGDNPADTWWVTEGPRSLCKAIVEDLGVAWNEYLSWVRDTINDLDGE